MTQQQVCKEIKLESYISSGRLTLQDSEFINFVENDIRNFVKNLSKKRVLLFPPLNNFRRFLIHQIVEAQHEHLKSFSIGEGEDRRTVVCFKRDYKATADLSFEACPPSRNDATVASVKNSIDRVSSLKQDTRNKSKRARTMPSVSIYRPPAARKLEQNAISHRETVGSSSLAKSRLKTSFDPKEVTPAPKKNENDGMSVFRNAISSIREQNKVTKCKSIESATKVVETEPKSNKEESGKGTNQNKLRRPDMQVYVPKGRRSAGVCSKTKKNNFSVLEEKSQKETEAAITKPENDCQCECTNTEILLSSTSVNEPLIEPKPEAVTEISEPKVSTEDSKTEEDTQCKVVSQTNSEVNNWIDQCEEQNSSNNISNSEKVSESKKNSTKMKCGSLNPEEDDWEAMFDDSGECLDPSLLDQLTNAVGDVTLEKPKSSYNGYKNKSLDTVADEFPHVIEIYNFPPEFQLQDLMMVFSQFKNSGFEIKWVDDTHALGIFSSSAIVSQVLDFYHPFVKTRSLKDGTMLSKMKARRSAEFLLPYKPRPETCSGLARRLVAGALGVRCPTSREEREAEKRILTKARERRRLEAKQKEDAWEGTFS